METKMGPNESRNESVNDGIFDAIAEANHEVYAGRGQLDKAANDPAATGKVGGGTPTKQKTQKSDDEVEGDNADGLDTQDFSRQPVKSTTETEETNQESEEHSETKTETQANTEIDWKATLPPDPGEFKVEAPKPDDNGIIDPEQYGDWILQKAAHQADIKAYNSALITATFDTIEKILPEIKEDEGLQAAIRSTFYSTLSGDETVKTAKNLRSTLDRIAGKSKAEGAQNAKTSITIQKNATVEAKGATQKKSTNTTNTDNLSKRLAKNDTSAFEELMGDWLEEGKI